jgi:plasmid maintenance system antidote protein VapI
MTAKQLFEEMHPGRTILEEVVKPLGMSINALGQGAPYPRHALK